MKKKRNLFIAMIFISGLASLDSVYSQEVTDSKFHVGTDLYNGFFWRGLKFGTTPAIQPTVEYRTGLFKMGAWGSFDFNGFQETDLYFNFSLPAGLSLGMTDYYSPDLEYFDYSGETGSHAFEINLGFSKSNFNISANYILNKAGSIGSRGEDMYFQAGYTFQHFNLFLGAGNGWLTYDPETGKDKFAVCNVGIGTSRNIKVSESFSIPVTGQLILNPDKEKMYIVIGFTL